MATSSGAAATRPISDPPPTEAQPICPICKGAGYYTFAVRVGDPNFGVLITCECRQAEKERRAMDELRRMSNIEPFASKTFETFDSTIFGVKRAFARAWEYARMPRGWLILFGQYGCGKTHLAAAIANEALKRHYRVLFAIVPDLLDHLRSTFGPNSEVEYDERFEIIRDVPLLILDDLGTENTTPWAREKLYQIINHRYNYGLSTVITSNRDPKDIEPRIFSRMRDRTLSEEIILMDADDYRQKSVNDRYTYRHQRHQER